MDFEAFLIDMSAHFINLPTDEIDNHIENAQRQVCGFLNFDCSTLWQWDDACLMRLTHTYIPPGALERPIFLDAKKEFPWTYNQILAKKTVALSTEGLPEEAAGERDIRRALGIKSFVVVPLFIADLSVGIISFVNLQKEQTFPPVLLRRLHLVAQIFTNAILRKEYEKRLQESEMRQRLAIDSAGAGIWEYDYRTDRYYFSDMACTIFNFDPANPISMQRFLNAIHDEDLPVVQKYLTNTLKNKNPLDQVFRVKSGANEVKWISCRGKPLCGNGGKVRKLVGVYLDVTRQKRLEQELRERLDEVETLKEQIEGENYYLREELLNEKGFEQIVGNSQPIKKILTVCKQVASTDATVLILGETGTGKGMLATAIHKLSACKDRPFITVNCAALPANLIESELFGREKGAFTGAHARQAGRFEIAGNGSIFLDEIGELPLDLQAKLLRVLQEGEFERVGGTTTLKVHARVIAATARDLEAEVRNGNFRQDLFYRLNVFPIVIPPLRQRTDDIASLLQHFIKKYNKKFGKHVERISRHTLYKLVNYEWPGNVRELEHLVERSIIVSTGSSFTLANSLKSSSSIEIVGDKSPRDLANIERNHIKEILRTTAWKIEGPGGAASILNLHPSTLRFRIKKLGIQRPV